MSKNSAVTGSYWTRAPHADALKRGQKRWLKLSWSEGGNGGGLKVLTLRTFYITFHREVLEIGKAYIINLRDLYLLQSSFFQT
jgi:hypothetical protein